MQSIISKQGIMAMTESPQVGAVVVALSGGLSVGAFMDLIPVATALAAFFLTCVLIYTHITRSRRDGKLKSLDQEKKELEIKLLKNQLSEQNKNNSI